MKEELLSIVTHALMGIDVEKETVDLIVNQANKLVEQARMEGTIVGLTVAKKCYGEGGDFVGNLNENILYYNEELCRVHDEVVA